MKNISLKIAKTYFNIMCEEEISVESEIKQYICDFKDIDKAINYKLSVVEEFSPLRCRFVSCIDERMSVMKSEDDLHEYRIFFNLNTKEPCALYKEIDEKNIEIVLLRRYFKKIIINSDILSYFGMEKYLVNEKAIILHSSFIVHNGEAILFTAPSGTGKSTQAELWRKYAHASIINGDRSVLMVEDGTVYAYGLPFCGTSEIDKNMFTKVKAIVYLQQWSKNNAIKISKKESIKKIISETTKNLWNQENIDKVVEVVENIAENIEMYEYHCTKYEDAVVYLKDKLEVV